MEEKFLISEANGKKMLARQKQINDDLMYYMEQGFSTSLKEMRKQLNKMLYDFAEQNDMSLWDLCFKVVPRTRLVDSKPDPRMYTFKDGIKLLSEGCCRTDEFEINLVPLEIDFEHGPEYWELQYRNLVKKLKELIENK